MHFPSHISWYEMIAWTNISYEILSSGIHVCEYMRVCCHIYFDQDQDPWIFDATSDLKTIAQVLGKFPKTKARIK